MKKVAILIDSSFSIKSDSIPDVYVAPMVISEDNNGEITNYQDEVNITHDQICQRLAKGMDIKTAQPIIGEVVTLLEKLTNEYEMVYGFTIPSTISGSFQTWKNLEQEFPNFKVFDQTLVGRLSAWTIFDFAEKNQKGELTVEYINTYLNQVKDKRAGVMIVPDVTQLKKGGRVSNFKSLLIKLFNLKLIITLDSHGLLFKDKAMDIKGSVLKAQAALNECLSTSNSKIKRFVIYSNAIDSKFKIHEYVDLVKQMYPNVKIEQTTLPAVIVAHVGPNYFVFGIDLE